MIVHLSGPAYSTETVGGETYVKATGSRGDVIASYDFNVRFPAEYVVWKETFSTNNFDNDISFRVDQGDWYPWHTPSKTSHSLWTQYYFQVRCLSCLAIVFLLLYIHVTMQSLPAQPISIQKAQPRKRKHMPLRTWWISPKMCLPCLIMMIKII